MASPESSDPVQMAVEYVVTRIENTIMGAMEETIVEIIPEHKEWAHGVAGRIFNALSSDGVAFQVDLGLGNET